MATLRSVRERTVRSPGPGTPGGGPIDTEQAQARKKAHRRRLSKNWSVFLLFAGPNIVLILAFIYYPLISNMYYSTVKSPVVV